MGAEKVCGATELAETSDAWRRAWRVGIAPQISSSGLNVLARALEKDDPRLLQGARQLPSSLCSRMAPRSAIRSPLWLK